MNNYNNNDNKPTMHRLLIQHARQIVQVCNKKELMLCGAETKEIVVFSSGSDDKGSFSGFR